MEDQNFFETFLQGFDNDAARDLTAEIDYTKQDISTKGVGVESDFVVDEGAGCSLGAMSAVEMSTEDKLRCNEKLDRSSPDLWPHDLPTAAANLLTKHCGRGAHAPPPAIGAQTLDRDDCNLLHQLSSLSTASLIKEMKKMQLLAAQLDIDEERELARGALLGVLNDKNSESVAKQERDKRNRKSFRKK